MLAVFTEFERDILRDRVKAGIEQARKDGKPHGRPITAGKLVGEMKQLRKEGLSKREIAKRLVPTDVASSDPPSGAEDNEYIVVVRATSGAGDRELTAERPIRVRVTDENEPPRAPEAPLFSGEGRDSLTVSWAEPENTGPPITGYDVQYRTGSDAYQEWLHTGPGRTATITDLDEGTVYQVQVRAHNEEGTGDWSEPGEGRTIAPLTVQMTPSTPPPVEAPFAMRFSFSEEVSGFTSDDIATQQEPPCTDSENNPVSCNPSFTALQTTDDRVFTTIVAPQTEGVAHNYTLTISVSEPPSGSGADGTEKDPCCKLGSYRKGRRRGNEE